MRVIQQLDMDLPDQGKEMSENHRRSHEVCDEADFPRNLGKQLIRAFGGAMQEGYFDGLKEVLKVGPDKLRSYIQLSLALLARKQLHEYHLRHWTRKTCISTPLKKPVFRNVKGP